MDERNQAKIDLKSLELEAHNFHIIDKSPHIYRGRDKCIYNSMNNACAKLNSLETSVYLFIYFYMFFRSKEGERKMKYSQSSERIEETACF